MKNTIITILDFVAVLALPWLVLVEWVFKAPRSTLSSPVAEDFLKIVAIFSMLTQIIILLLISITIGLIIFL